MGCRLLPHSISVLGQVAGSGSDNGVVCFTGVLAILLVLLIYLFPTLSTFFLLLLLFLAFSPTLRIYLVCSLHLPFSNLFNLFTTPSHYLAPDPSIETLTVGLVYVYCQAEQTLNVVF